MKYRTVVIDPPWSPNDALSGKSRGAAKNYPTLSVDEILGIYPLQHMMDPNSRMFLWRLSSMPEEALQLMRAYGFTPKSEIIWLKKTRKGLPWFGMGRQVRNSHETCLIGTRGRPERLSASIRSVFEAPWIRHSGKPEAFYALVQQLSPPPYLELFSRTQRPDWNCLGLDIGRHVSK